MPEAIEFFFCPALLDAVESIVDPEIFNPINHVRPYVPARRGGRDSAALDAADRGRWPHGAHEERWSCPMATWHMDQTVATPDADGVDILTVWIAMVDTSVENARPIASHLTPHSPTSPRCQLRSPWTSHRG